MSSSNSNVAGDEPTDLSSLLTALHEVSAPITFERRSPESRYVAPGPPAQVPYSEYNIDRDHRETNQDQHQLVSLAQPSPAYQGCAQHWRNICADIPSEENCSVFVTGLPGHIGYYDLLQRLQYGRIVQTHINAPTGHYNTAAAKVVFWNRVGAENFMTAVRCRDFAFYGHRVRATWNRVKVAPQDPADVTSSRVIRVRGPREIVNEESLCAFLWDHFYFDLEEIVNVEQGLENTTLEIRFGSFWCQSENAFRCLRESHPDQETMTVEWVPDPCNVAEA
ncbi:Enoyl reductase LovC [Apiospora rasikravindrae]|uniref:Enoyl reductase LovC n=1 Tax=Apiospora rasikravindrae TaxID=990691 RepID=A0ABR1SCP6_9PEZI